MITVNIGKCSYKYLLDKIGIIIIIPIFQTEIHLRLTYSQHEEPLTSVCFPYSCDTQGMQRGLKEGGGAAGLPAVTQLHFLLASHSTFLPPLPFPPRATED